VALYGGITLLVIFIIGTLFAITRISSFVNGITVPRVDQNGAPVSGTGGGGRVNVLLMGLDLRPNDQNDGTRSDTMILVSIDQNHKAASMLSIPRDLWVDIPGHGTNRVNAAYNFGDQDKPGTGGPPLAKATVSNLLGVSVDYFVQVDFNGFRQIVDAIGGITIDVKKPLVDNEYPTEDFGIKRIYIPAGIQHMDGQTALEYARSRHGDTDLGRNQRQQAVLLAIREQGINLGAVTNNELQQALQGAIKTDLQTTDILGLVQTGIGMNKDNIRSYSIDANLAKQTFIDGNDVLLPDKEGIRALVRQMLNPPVTTTGTSATAGTKETATINVLNGTFTAGLASRTQQFLEGKGYTINGVEQAGDAGQYPRSIIRVYNGKQKTASELAGLLGISSGQIQVKSGGPPGVDIEIVCGEDLKIPQ
jgi:LCP family protein required for cell wall assembly